MKIKENVIDIMTLRLFIRFQIGIKHTLQYASGQSSKWDPIRPENPATWYGYDTEAKARKQLFHQGYFPRASRGGITIAVNNCSMRY